VEKIWLKHYPKGVPPEINVDEYASIREVFEESVAKYASRPAFSCMGKSLTFSELDTLSAAFDAWLQGMGCKPGARVALMMPNILQYPVCLFGALRAGCTVVNVNPLYTARELEHQLNDSGAEVLVCLENFASVFAQVRGKTKVRQTVLTSVGELLSFKGLLVDFVLRRVKKVVPAFSIPGAIRLSDALAEGPARIDEPLGGAGSKVRQPSRSIGHCTEPSRARQGGSRDKDARDVEEVAAHARLSLPAGSAVGKMRADL